MRYSDLAETANCPRCEVIFYKKVKAQIFCSESCSINYKRELRNVKTYTNKCVYCGKEFNTLKSFHLYCSQLCGQRHRKIKMPSTKEWSLLSEHVHERDNYKCSMCNKNNNERLEVHHKKPLSMGGDNNIDNLELLCVKCHVDKHIILRSIYK